MKRDNTESKKNVFRELKDLGYTNDEIRRALGCSERTLYRWANEEEDEAYEKEVEQKTVENEQKLQNEVNELREHVERLSEYYTRLWNQVHLRQKYSEQEVSPFQQFFEVFMANSDKRQTILSQQLQKCHEFEMERELKEGRLSAPDTYRDLHFSENVAQMARWNREIDIRNGRVPTDVGSPLDLDVPIRDENEVMLYCDTVEGRGFEMRVADMCLKTSCRRILDRIEI